MSTARQTTWASLHRQNSAQPTAAARTTTDTAAPTALRATCPPAARMDFRIVDQKSRCPIVGHWAIIDAGPHSTGTGSC